MGWRFIWNLVIERDDEPSPHPGLLKWAIVGLAVIGLTAVLVYRALT